MVSRLPLLIAVLCVVLVFAFALRLRTSHPPGPNIFPMMPLTPLQRAAFNKWGSLELAARAAEAKEDWGSAEADYQAEILVRYCHPY